MIAKSALVLISGWILFLYTAGVILAELIVGGQAATVVANNYGQDIGGVAIDSLCRQWYGDVKNIAICFVSGAGVACLLLFIAFVRFVLLDRSSARSSNDERCVSAQPFWPCSDATTDLIDIFPIAANGIVCVIGLVLSAYATWKFHDTSTNCHELWNGIDTGFEAIFQHCQKILILTGVLGSGWIIVLCVFAFLREQ